MLLTARELQVLAARAEGATQKAFAVQLSITQSAVSRFEQTAHKKVLDAELVLGASRAMGVRTEHSRSGQRRVRYGRRVSCMTRGRDT